ncbi:efflux transporter outer membrane subunit [Ralstonia pseudosolanacearum]|uniref:efflux transporter outer membrane subunit n=1 Tax=Ralstonia pseudosolanacearum TaxID=1310165 RepID=UPI00267499CC|nr:efflux transporter outer membrane subunit [Ralstonia pseudosolanacearum]MDO3526371.1 efflux transporter outer membrane subunit [Ralstonia pseudosolanacearum]
MLAAVALALGGCALQPAYESPDLLAPPAWSVQSSDAPANADAWWSSLGDDAINNLTEAAFASSPTLAQAVARIDEAQASLGVSSAAQGPTVGASANVSRAKSQNFAGQGSSPAGPGTSTSTSASYGPTFSWEIDLFGRVRQSVEAARNRLDARTADAASARLALAADVADGVLSLRACENSRRIIADDIASREKTLELTRMRLKTGFAAPVDEARAMAGIASTRTSLALQEEQCARQVNALVALSGRDPNAVRQLVGTSGIPQAPAAAPEFPAKLLTAHPGVMSAEHEAAAAWAEIGVARADRLPRLNLAAALTGQWIRAGGSTLDFTTWSIGPSVTGTLFDGGAGAANVSAAQARYRRAVAGLQSTLRSSVQDVENALAGQASAKARVVSAGDSVAAARITLQATEVQWKAGATSLFELEDSRRQFASAQDAEVSARRDQAQAWVALVKASGGAITLSSESRNHE